MSEVVAVPHALNSRASDFVEILTESGRSIRLTPDHLLPTGVCGGSGVLGMQAAAKIAVGDCLATVEGESRVIDVSESPGAGVYSIVTKEEYLVVNGIVASPFARSHDVGNLLYVIPRFVYSLVPTDISSMFFKQFWNFASQLVMESGL